MAKSILDRAVSVDPSDIEVITATMYAECTECQIVWASFDQWFKDRKQDHKTIPFHWSIACCPKHAEVIRCFIEGVEPKEKDRTLIDIDIDIANLEVRIANGQSWKDKNAIVRDGVYYEEEQSYEWKQANTAILHMLERKNELHIEWNNLFNYLNGM